MPSITSVLKVSKINICNSAIWIHDHTDTDVTIFLVFAIKSIPDYIITGFLM